MTVKINCADCDFRIFTDNAERRCVVCQWLAELPDPAERERMRAKLAARGFIGKPRPAAERAYRDDTRPERACDHCGKPYRGGAVFCSLDCAKDSA